MTPEERKSFDDYWKVKEQSFKDIFKFEGMKGVVYQTWKDSKSHAEELAKTSVTIKETMMSGWNVYKSGSSIMDHLGDSNEARTWAESKGYRVVD